MSLPKAGLGDKITVAFDQTQATLPNARVFRLDQALKMPNEREKNAVYNSRILATSGSSNDKLGLVDSYNKDFYAICAQEEFNRLTKKHSFRSMVNQDRSKETGSDILNKVRRKQNASPLRNSSSLKFSLQEYNPSIEIERKNSIKLRKKTEVRSNVVTGEVKVNRNPTQL